MKIAYKLFPCGVPLFVAPGPRVPPPPCLLSPGEYQRVLRAHPAVELLSRRQGGQIEVPALPSLEWRGFLEIASSEKREEPALPELESFVLPEGGGVLIPSRTLPWTRRENPSAPSSLSSGLEVVNVSGGEGPVEPLYNPVLDRQVAELCEHQNTLSGFLKRVRELEATFGVPPSPAPEPDLWLDMLRCAGSPPTLEAELEGLVKALVPALRFLAHRAFGARHVSNAVSGFLLWLSALREVGITTGYGDDLFALWEFALPLTAGLVHGERPASEQLSENFRGEGGGFNLPVGQPLGLAFLEGMRGARYGALLELRCLGRALLRGF